MASSSALSSVVSMRVSIWDTSVVSLFFCFKSSVCCSTFLINPWYSSVEFIPMRAYNPIIATKITRIAAIISPLFDNRIETIPDEGVSGVSPGTLEVSPGVLVSGSPGVGVGGWSVSRVGSDGWASGGVSAGEISAAGGSGVAVGVGSGG